MPLHDKSFAIRGWHIFIIATPVFIALCVGKRIMKGGQIEGDLSIRVTPEPLLSLTSESFRNSMRDLYSLSLRKRGAPDHLHHIYVGSGQISRSGRVRLLRHGWPCYEEKEENQFHAPHPGRSESWILLHP